jgi:Fe-S-cluster containining protein
MSEIENPRPVDSKEAIDARSELRQVYEELDAEIARLSPRCELSGRCCRFLEYEHTLFLSTIEADYLLRAAPPPVRELDDGATCPWQNESGRCTAREGRPLGCRVYFCDPKYIEQAPELSERYLAKIKSITARGGLPWDYASLHRHLEGAKSAGFWPKG